MAEKKDFTNFGTQNFKKSDPTINLPEKEANAEKVTAASDIFSNVLTRKEKKTERMQILLTKTNRKTLEEYAEKTGRSKNDIINELISTLEKYAEL